MISTKSPLQYPGGKRLAVKMLLELIPVGTKRLVSPFLGGGNFELAAASQGIQVIGYDVCPPLVDFWQELLSSPADLALEILKYFPLTKERFSELQRAQRLDRISNGAVFYALNRSAFSGCAYTGGMSLGHPRFRIDHIVRLANFNAPNLKVRLADFKESIQRHRKELLYCDPPYALEKPDRLYGLPGKIPIEFNHDVLREILGERDRWILSYNDCEYIRQLYHGLPMIFPKWKYSMGKNRESKEIVIMSYDIASEILK